MTDQVKQIITNKNREGIHKVEQYQMIYVIQEFLFEVKGVRVEINIMKGFPRLPKILHQQVLADQIEKLSRAYDIVYAYYKNQLNDE